MSLPIRTLRDGLTKVTTAGTRVQLAESPTPAFGAVSIIINALNTNTGDIVVGGATVVAGPGTQGTPTQRGVRLAKGDSISLDLIDIAAVYIDSVTSGDGVSWVVGAA